MTARRPPFMKIEICILAGGLSSRFGKDKARLRFGRRTMLSIIRRTALEIGCPVRVIRRDRVKRCGPLSGVFTALQTTRADSVLFLACDMPLVTAELLRQVIHKSGNGSRAVFAGQKQRVGFPFLLPLSAINEVESQIARNQFSIHALASVTNARTVRVPTRGRVLFNVNALPDAQIVRELLAAR